jgi:hypothetical protein
MKIRYYCHASFQFVSRTGARLLSDPWVYNPISNTLWQFPECPVSASEYVEQDYLYISHNHTDHLCPETLAHFRRDIPILIRRYVDETNTMMPTLRRLGFSRIIEVGHKETVDLDGHFKVTLFADLNTNDSSILVDDGEHGVYNQNDCMLALDDARSIRTHGPVDFALVGLINSSIYPMLFVMDEELKEKENLRITRKILARTCSYAEAIGAPVVMPCGCDMTFARLPWADKFTGPTIDQLVSYAAENQLPFRVLTPAPGDWLDMANLPEKCTPAYRDKDDYVAQLNSLRERPEVQETFARLESWERSFVFDAPVFFALFQKFVQHVDENFLDIFSTHTAVSNAKHYGANIAIHNGDHSFNYRLEFEFGKHRVGLTQHPFSLELLPDTDIVLETEAACMQMLIEGALDFDDVRAGSITIRRPADFCAEEVAFWHLMMSFTGWLAAHHLFVAENRTFMPRFSATFGPSMS